MATKENKRRFKRPNLSAKDSNHRTPTERSHKRSGGIGRSISNSTLFVLTRNNNLRPVINLKSLNNCVQLEKFKLEGLDMVRTLLTPGDYLMKLDLKDAYFRVPIYEPDKKYLRFQFQNITYEFQYLQFGLYPPRHELSRSCRSQL